MARRESVLAGTPRRPSEPQRASVHRSLRGLAIAATGTTFLLVAIGALVRATGSGLGCSGWPKCSAHRWLPPLQYHAIIEYTHRMTAFVDIVLVAVLAVAAWRRYRDVPRVFRPAIAAAGLIVVQAVLGGIVVKRELSALLVTAHFAAAMILAATLVYLTVASFTIEATPRPPVDDLTRLARVTAGLAFILLVVGAYVRGDNAGLAFVDWPLMNGRLLPSVQTSPAALMFAHRLLALAVAVLVLVLCYRAWREREGRAPVAVLAMTTGVLYVAQVLIGAALVWSRLSAPARVAHVAVSSLVWGGLVAVAATARVVPGRRASGRPAGRSVAAEVAG